MLLFGWRSLWLKDTLAMTFRQIGMQHIVQPICLKCVLPLLTSSVKCSVHCSAPRVWHIHPNGPRFLGCTCPLSLAPAWTWFYYVTCTRNNSSRSYKHRHRHPTSFLFIASCLQTSTIPVAQLSSAPEVLQAAFGYTTEVSFSMKLYLPLVIPLKLV